MVDKFDMDLELSVLDGIHITLNNQRILDSFSFTTDGGRKSTATDEIRFNDSVSTISNDEEEEDDGGKAVGSITESSASSANLTRKKRRKRGLRIYEQKDDAGNWLIPHIPLPRIPKQDIRRNYGQMVANVFNSNSRKVMGDFLHQMMNEHGRYTLHSCGQSFQLARGRDMLADYWYESMQESPDMIFKFEAKQIKVRSDGTAVVSGIYQFGGTLILSSEDQRRKKADWQYMSTSFRLQGNEIAPVSATNPQNNENSSTNTCHTQETGVIEVGREAPMLVTPSSSSNSNNAVEVEDEVTALANAFLRQHILEPSIHQEEEGQKGAITIDYKTEGIFALHIDADYRLDGVEATLDRYYLNHQLASWLQGPNALTEFAQSYF